MTAIDVEVQVGTAPLVDVDVQVEPPTFTVISVLPTGPRGPAGADGTGLPSGGSVGQVVTNTAPGEGEWDDAGGAVDSVNTQTGVVVLDAADVGADPAGTAATAVATHAGLPDPHPGYLTPVEGNAAYDAAGAAATVDAALTAHISDAADAHDASAVSFVPNGSIAATDVQAAIQEVRDEAGAGGAPTDASYLTTTAHAGLSAEEVVGATPGGELGGTWASPTVDATHSGSSHAATQAAAEATAASALSGHEADTTAVHGIANTANLVLTDDSRLTDARTPTAHATSHQDGGSDEIALDASQVTTGSFDDARIPAAVARDSEVTSAVAAEATLARNADNLTSGTVADARIASTIARDSEVTTAVSDHNADTTAVHGIADTSLLETATGAQAKVDAHVNDATDAHDAVAVSTSPTFGTGTDVEAVLDVLTTEISVLAYGARRDYDGSVGPGVGDNPTILAANDAAFTLAWADAKAARAMLYIPAGNYGLSPSILATDTDDAGIRCEDIATTIIWCVDTTDAGTFVSQSITDATYWSNATRKALPSIIPGTLDGTWVGTGSVAARIGPAHSGYFEARIRNFDGVGGANGVTGETGAIGMLIQNNPAAATQFTESYCFGPRFSVQNCTNTMIVDKNGGNKSFGYMHFEQFHFRNNTNGIKVVNGAWLYGCKANLQGVTTTAITASGITVTGSDSRFTGRIDFEYEINSASAVVTLITTGAGTWWKTTGKIDALTGAFALPTNSISSTSVFEHDGPFFSSAVPAGTDGWFADGTFDGGIAGDEIVRTAGASGVASEFTKYGDFTNRYKVGVPTRWTEGGVVKFGVVSIDSTFAAERTTVTLAASTLYWMAGDPDIGSLRFSFGQPPDFPATFKLTALGLDPDLATLSLPASTTISSFIAAALDEATSGAFLAALGIDADIATLALPASTTISAYGATLVDDADAPTARTTLGVGTGDTPTFAGLALTGALNEAQGATIASAATVDIGAATGNYVAISGTTTITSFGTAPAGTRRIVVFNGALTLTHNATSLKLPGDANITTVGGDVGTFVSLGSGNWKFVSYQKKTVTGTGAQVLATSPTLTTPTLNFASTLSVYEEGNWTPVVIGATTAGSITYTVNAGRYTRVGRMVFVSAYVHISSLDTAAGNVRITGLPYTVLNTNGAANSFPFNSDALTTAVYSIVGRCAINTTYCEVYHRDATHLESTIQTTIADLSATSKFIFAAAYCV